MVGLIILDTVFHWKNMNFILGTKVKMTQIFTETDEVVPVTVIQAGPCRVTQVKRVDTDGYDAIQIGYGLKRSLVKPLLGHMRDLPAYRWLREFRLDKVSVEAQHGQEIGVETFAVGEKVKVVGESKGKGFQGVVRRHSFHGSPASHGHKDQLRMPGSIGATDSARVFKGTRMAGRMGGAQITVANLEVVKVDPENNLLYVRGAVPGPRTGFVKIYGTGELQFRAITVPPSEVQPETGESSEGQKVVPEMKDAVDKSEVSNEQKDEIKAAVASDPKAEATDPTEMKAQAEHIEAADLKKSDSNIETA